MVRSICIVAESAGRVGLQNASASRSRRLDTLSADYGRTYSFDSYVTGGVDFFARYQQPCATGPGDPQQGSWSQSAEAD